MGKKLQGAALRAKKRAQQAVETLQELQADQIASQQVQAKADTDLFILDSKGDKTNAAYKAAIGSGAFAKERKKKEKRRGLSEKDQREVDRLRSLHDAASLEKLAQRGRELLERGQRGGGRHRKRLHGVTKANFDLWGNDDDDDVGEGEEARSRKKPKQCQGVMSSGPAGIAPAHVPVKAKPFSSTTDTGIGSSSVVVKVDVAKTGQSYHPDPVSHTKVIETAVAVELQRNAAINERQTPLAKGLAEETRRILLGDSDTDDDSGDEEASDASDDEQGGELGKPVGPIPKRADKLTRAQRNKKKRLREEQIALQKRKHEKKFLNQVSEIPRFAKEIKREEAEIQERNERIARLKAEQQRITGKNVEEQVASLDPVNAPTLPVALSCELKSSLRLVKPKGSLVQDRLHSLVDRKLAVKRDTQAPKPKKRRIKVQGGVKGPGFEIKG